MTPQAIDFETGFNNAFQDGIQLLPKVGYFLLILILGYFVAKAIQKIVAAVLQKVGFDRLVERGGVKQALSASKYDAATILARIVFYFIFLFVLSAAFNVFGDNAISNFLQLIIFYLPKLFAAVLIIVVAAAVAAAVKEIVTNALGGLAYGAMLANAASLFVVAVGVFAALDQLEIAPLIVTGIFYALVALVVVPLIIAFGVGGIDPAREAIRTAQDKGRQRLQEVRAEVSAEDGADGAPMEPDDEQPAPVPTRRPTRARTAAATTRRRRPSA